MRVLVPGIAGFVGKAVQNELLAAGHEVIGMIRSVKDRQMLDRRVSVIMGDVTDTTLLRDKLPAIDACIYLPGLLREFPQKGVNFKSVHADGVRNVMEAAKSKGAGRWVQMSALGVGRGLQTGYYETKLQGEAHVKASGLGWTIFRPSVVFSREYDPRPNFVSELGNIIRRSPVIPVFGDGKYRLQPIALEVLARAMVASLAMPESYGKTYEVGGPEKLRYRDILRTIADAQGLSKKPMISVPFGPFKFLASILDQYPFFPVTRGQLAMLEHENVVEDPAMQAEFEHTFRPEHISFAEGVKSYFASKR